VPRHATQLIFVILGGIWLTIIGHNAKRLETAVVNLLNYVLLPRPPSGKCINYERFRLVNSSALYLQDFVQYHGS